MLITELADILNVELSITRAPGSNDWRVGLENVSVSGWGRTYGPDAGAPWGSPTPAFTDAFNPSIAMKNLCESISGRELTFTRPDDGACHRFIAPDVKVPLCFKE